MARNRWKYSTIGLGILLGAGAVFYLAVIAAPHLTASTNNQPSALEGVPDQWAVHTWDNGQQVAKYYSSAADCTLDVVKEGGGNVTLHILLTCEGAEEGDYRTVHRSDNSGGGQHTFITEPADFEFYHLGADGCSISINYGSDWRHGGLEDIRASVHCREQE